MDLYKLAALARSAIDQMDHFEIQYGKDDSLKSIRKQMEFIYTNAMSGTDPMSMLGDRALSYAVIASREFASPEELKITEKLNQVSRILEGRDNEL